MMSLRGDRSVASVTFSWPLTLALRASFVLSQTVVLQDEVYILGDLLVSWLPPLSLSRVSQTSSGER